MTRYVVDSWAWIEYMDGSGLGRKVDKLISGNVEVWTSVVSLAELASKYSRKGMDRRPVIDAVMTLSRLGVPDGEDAAEAGEIHAIEKRRSPNFSLPDSFVLQLARKIGAKVLTGDPDFRKVKEAELIE
jgi:predicted nucleic acid-binding protein